MISFNISKTRIHLCGALMLLLATVQFSCKKSIIQDDPYKGGKEPLGVKFIGDEPDPANGAAGDVVTFKVNGLSNYPDKFEFYINETKAEVLSYTDSTLSVTIPQNASSGGTTLLLEGQSFFGPKFTVNGKVSIDPSFKAINGANGPIMDVLQTANGNYLIVGLFTNFESQSPDNPVNKIASISNDGVINLGFNSGQGADGILSTINPLSNGKYMVSGLLSSYNRRRGMNGVTRINSDGSLDSTSVELINIRPENPAFGLDTVASFNGGVPGVVAKSFVRDSKVTLLGAFENYVSYFYYRSTRDFKVADYTKMSQLVRLKEDGVMDSTFNFDPVAKRSYPGANGNIADALMQADGKIIAVGDFTTFNGISSNRVFRINLDGSLDQTFAVGTGADGPVSKITSNAVTGKILLSGNFKTFDGKPKNGVVMLNANGSVDDTFIMGTLTGGAPNYAGQLNNGKILVSGGFRTYNGIIRQGFMILNADGSLAAGYNNTGAFEGSIRKVVETTSALGNPAVVIVGSFEKFDNKKVGHIVRVEIKQ